MINGVIQHFIMGLVSVPVSCMIFGHAYEAATMMLMIEAMQIKQFGLRGRVLDTIVDLAVDAVGGIIGYLIMAYIIIANL